MGVEEDGVGGFEQRTMSERVLRFEGRVGCNFEDVLGVKLE